ncbi:MAG: hypothetical protein WCK96_06925 [Methylococcales bacterium]
MIIILKKISSKTRQEDIADILLPAVYGGWLAKRGQIERTLILAQRNIRTRLVQHHVLAEILPDFVAERVIKQLNGKRISGKYIAVSEYRVRNWHNDPRVNHSYALVCKRNNNRRACDRRNEYEEIISEFNANKYDKA